MVKKENTKTKIREGDYEGVFLKEELQQNFKCKLYNFMLLIKSDNVSEENDRIYYSLKLFVGNIKILDKEYSLLEKNVQIDISRPINAVSKYTVKEIKENLIKNKWKRLTKYQSSKLAEILDSENPRRIYLGLKIKDYR